MLCHNKDGRLVNSIKEVSHTTGKALVAYSKKKASKIKIGRNIEIELVPG